MAYRFAARGPELALSGIRMIQLKKLEENENRDLIREIQMSGFLII